MSKVKKDIGDKFIEGFLSDIHSEVKQKGGHGKGTDKKVKNENRYAYDTWNRSQSE